VLVQLFKTVDVFTS